VTTFPWRDNGRLAKANRRKSLRAPGLEPGTYGLKVLIRAFPHPSTRIQTRPQVQGYGGFRFPRPSTKIYQNKSYWLQFGYSALWRRRSRYPALLCLAEIFVSAAPRAHLIHLTSTSGQPHLSAHASAAASSFLPPMAISMQRPMTLGKTHDSNCSAIRIDPPEPRKFEVAGRLFLRKSSPNRNARRDLV